MISRKHSSHSGSSLHHKHNAKKPRYSETMKNHEDEDDNENDDYAVIIIGAGAAGIGLASCLKCGFMDTDDMLILEQGPSIGTSFRQWHKTTTFISPSWPSFPYGVQDLNVVFPDASLGGAQHATGDEYADYLEDQANNYTMNIRYNQTVSRIVPSVDEDMSTSDTNDALPTDLFLVYTEGRDKPFTANVVVWCGGEWSSPRKIDYEKYHQDSVIHYRHADLQQIASDYLTTTKNSNDPIIVVGMGEAGADVAAALVEEYKIDTPGGIIIIDGNDPNEPESKDPSCRLSPKSTKALKQHSGIIRVVRGQTCVSIGQMDNATKKIRVDLKAVGSTIKNVESNDSKILYTSSKVIMCTGFDVSQNPVIQDLFHWREDGCPELDKQCDESTKTTNLFCCGPMLRHDIDSCEMPANEEDKTKCQTAIFCYIYKFRTRFPVVAEEIIFRVVHERYSVPDEDGEPIITREGQMWGAAAETMTKYYKEKGMYLSEITEACGTCG